MSKPWYVESFKEDYLKIYAHRTDEAAAQEIEQINSILDMPKNCKVLDLCCGNGRHSRQLAKLGLQVTGIDLSEVLLEEAKRKNVDGNIRYVQGDAREIPFHEEFDYVLNLFTSFGYFSERDENMRVFKAIQEALKKEGCFLIDYLNPTHVKNNLIPQSQKQVEDLLITEKRHIVDQTVRKTIVVQEGTEQREYEEIVQLFEFEEMQTMLEQAGLTILHVYGNYDLTPYTAETSPRMIIVGKKY